MPLLTGGAPAAAWTAKRPGLQATGPTYRAALVPKAHGGSFSPLQGHPDLHPANGAVTPHRLPAEHKGSHTQTLVTGGSTPREPESSAFPCSSHRNETQQPGSGAARPKAQGQGGRTPGPAPLKGRGQRYPPDYRGALQAPPAKRRGHAQPYLQGGPPRLGTHS